MGALMGPGSVSHGRGKAPGIQPGVTRSEGGKGVAIRGKESKVVGSIASAMDSIGFDEGKFAVLMANLPARVQQRFIKVLYGYFSHLAGLFERGLWMDDDQMELYANAARARDSLSHFM